ncbi:MAG: DUF1552 domain-containing protein [Verrucomicrobium sp.]|nr:DUF1552 domain-containing protein [Verrucomicrobium sp.]
MNLFQPQPRRTFLRGLGTAVALPFLASAPSVRALGAAAGKAAAAGKPPLRMAFVYIPNGAMMKHWTPEQVGSSFDLPRILQPLAPVRDQLTVLSGLAHDKARPNGDGAGDHARASATFLTACQARKTQGADLRVGVSVDQWAAQKVGNQTRFASLELGTDRGQLSGQCDSGYSCAYSFNVSWRTASTPMPPEVDPKLAFDRLFAGGDDDEAAEAKARRQARRASVLDFVLEDARRLHGQLGRNDQQKLDEYMSAVRDVERRITMADKVGVELPDHTRPQGVPSKFEDHVKLMFDILTLAFRTDSTRIASFILAHDGSNRPYPVIGVKEGHHDLSHHESQEDKKEKITKINVFHMQMFAAWLQQLQQTRDATSAIPRTRRWPTSSCRCSTAWAHLPSVWATARAVWIS